MARTNRKLDRLRLRVIDAEAKMRQAAGGSRFAHRGKIFLQRSRILARAEENGDRNAEVNHGRMLAGA